MFRVITLQIWIQMWQKSNNEILSVYAKIWTQITRMNDGPIIQICHTAALDTSNVKIIVYILRRLAISIVSKKTQT
jgi:hypothetical protein